MKSEIPAVLKSDLPQNLWGKIFGATPIVMTVVATVLAGLSSSEMTRAQYDRALAAQMQSKAGDQWGLFQAKRMRSAIEKSTLDLISASFELHDLGAEAGASPELRGVAGSAKFRDALRLASSPGVAPGGTVDPRVAAATAAIEASLPEKDIDALLAPLDTAAIDRALQEAQANARDFDRAMAPAEDAVAFIGSALGSPKPGPGLSLGRDFTALRLRREAERYDAEARLNRAIANIYELKVRKGNLSAERHHVRSQRFFYGMLGAQMAVIVATFAMAAKRRNLLWSLAAAAGLGAVSFALYVYLNV